VPTKKENLSLIVTHPELAKEAVGWDPSHVTYLKRELLVWQCQDGHQWSAKILDRIKGASCPNCHVVFKDIKRIIDAKRITEPNVSIKENLKQSLSLTHPELAKEAVGWDPSQVTSGSNKKMLWRCRNGHEWEALVSNRSRGRGCRICSTKDYNQKRSEIRREKLISLDLVPEKNTGVEIAKKRKRKKKVKSATEKFLLIHKGHLENGCAVCSGKKVLVGFNDLESKFPEIASESDGWNPQTVSYGSGVKKNWICKLGHRWEASPNLRSQGSNCPYCSHKFLLIGFNDLATTNPELISEADEWDPSLVIGAFGQRLAWKCSIGHKWKATINSRSRGRGCPSCAKSGFDPNKDGFFYLLNHGNWEMLQIGITNFPENRLRQHKKLGWELLELRGPMDGHLTQQWETAILRMLKAKGADLSNAEIAGKFDGFSEAWSKSTFAAKSIKELMRITEEFEEK